MQSRAADGDAERIRALNAGWAAAAARRDLDGMMAIYAHEPRS
jgi:ketosteroid isomerase-like protein